MSLDTLVNVTVSVRSVQPSQAGFGTPLVLAYTTVGAGGALVSSFSGLQEAVDAGHAAGSAVYTALAALFSQNPRPPVVKVGRRGTSNPQVVHMLPTVTTEGTKYTLTINIAGGVSYDITYTVLASSSVTIISTALKAAIDALTITGLTCTVDGTSNALVLTSAAAKVFQYQNVTALLTVEDKSAATNFVTDLASVIAEDDDWYLLIGDVHSKAAITAMAASVETKRKLYVCDTNDSAVLDGGSTTDVAYTLKASAYARTFLQFHPDCGLFSAAALAAGRLTAQPGSDTWAYKTLRGIRAYRLNTTQEGVCKVKRANTYTGIAGVGASLYGVSPSGEYLDTARGVDWMVARMKERVYAVFLNNPKVPYTDSGVEVIKNEVRAVLAIAASDAVNFIAPGSYTVNAPKVADVSSGDKVARVLNGLTFTGQLQGAIHELTITGTLTP